MSLEEQVKAVFRHPAYLAHALDGETVRICMPCGDIYIGVESDDGGVEIATGTILVNPHRLQIDCVKEQLTPVLMTSDEFKSDAEAVGRALETLVFAEQRPELIMAQDTARDAYDEWTRIVRENKEKQAPSNG